MRIIDELMGEELVLSTGETEYSGGRRRPLLEINSKSTVIIGVDLGGTAIYGAAIDLCGTVLVEQHLDNQPAPADEFYNRLAQLIQCLIQNQETVGRKILGLAVGTQGLTSHQTGIVLRDPIQNWENYPLKQKLMDDFGVPVVIDNDVYLAALGELWFGVGRKCAQPGFYHGWKWGWRGHDCRWFFVPQLQLSGRRDRLHFTRQRISWKTAWGLWYPRKPGLFYRRLPNAPKNASAFKTTPSMAKK